MKHSKLLSAGEVRKKLAIPKGSFTYVCLKAGVRYRYGQEVRGRWTYFYSQDDVKKIEMALKERQA